METLRKYITQLYAIYGLEEFLIENWINNNSQSEKLAFIKILILRADDTLRYLYNNLIVRPDDCEESFILSDNDRDVKFYSLSIAEQKQFYLEKLAYIVDFLANKNGELNEYDFNMNVLENSIMILDGIRMSLMDDTQIIAPKKWDDFQRDIMSKATLDSNSVEVYFKGKLDGLLQVIGTPEEYKTLLNYILPNVKDDANVASWYLYNKPNSIPKNNVDMPYIAENFSEEGNKWFKPLQNGVRSLPFNDTTNNYRRESNQFEKAVVAGACTVECGYKSNDYVEYFAEGKDLNGRLFFRINEKGEWVSKTSNNLKPYVLTKDDIVTPFGFSGLPKVVEDRVPSEYIYWTIEDDTKRLELKNKLKANLKTVGLDFNNLIINENGMFQFQENKEIDITGSSNVTGLLIKAQLQLKNTPFKKDFALIYQNNNLTAFEVFEKDGDDLYLQQRKMFKGIIGDKIESNIWTEILSKSFDQDVKEDDFKIISYNVDCFSDFEEENENDKVGYLIKAFDYDYELNRTAYNLWKLTSSKSDGKINIDVMSKAIGDNGELTVAGVVLRPSVVDKQGEKYSPEVVKETAENWLMNYAHMALQHTKVLDKQKQVGVLQSYIAQTNFTYPGSNYKIKKGDWVLVTKLFDKKIIAGIMEGRINSYSIGGIKYIK